MSQIENIYDELPFPFKIIICIPVWIVVVPCFFIYSAFQGILFGIYIIKNLFNLKF